MKEIEAQVRCCGSLHKIRLTKKGRFVLCNHNKESLDDLNLLTLLANKKECRCLRIQKAWKYKANKELTPKDKSIISELPDSLYRAYKLLHKNTVARRLAQRLAKNRKESFLDNSYLCTKSFTLSRCNEDVQKELLKKIKIELERRKYPDIQINDKRSWTYGALAVSSINKLYINFEFYKSPQNNEHLFGLLSRKEMEAITYDKSGKLIVPADLVSSCADLVEIEYLRAMLAVAETKDSSTRSIKWQKAKNNVFKAYKNSKLFSSKRAADNDYNKTTKVVSYISCDDPIAMATVVSELNKLISQPYLKDRVQINRISFV